VQVRERKLLRAVTQGMLLMEERITFYTRMQATLATGCDCLGRDSAGISPLRLGFTGTLKVIPRAIPDFQDIQPEQLPFYTKLIRF